MYLLLDQQQPRVLYTWVQMQSHVTFLDQQQFFCYHGEVIHKSRLEGTVRQSIRDGRRLSQPDSWGQRLRKWPPAVCTSCTGTAFPAPQETRGLHVHRGGEQRGASAGHWSSGHGLRDPDRSQTAPASSAPVNSRIRKPVTATAAPTRGPSKRRLLLPVSPNPPHPPDRLGKREGIGFRVYD